MFSICSLILIAWLGWFTVSRGRRWALGSGILLTLLVPAWVKLTPEGLPIDLRVVTASVGLLIYFFHPRTRWRGPVVAADLLLAAMIGIQVISDSVNEGFTWLIPVRAYGEWALPYLAGRWAIHEIDDVKRLLPVALAVVTVLALWGAIEALIRVNPVNFLVGERPLDMTVRVALRWGFKRAEGPTMHPIFFGMLQLLLVPWSLQAAWSAMSAQSPRRWLAGPVASALGVFCSGSRGPILALGMAGYVVAALRWERARKYVLVAGALLAVVLFVQRQAVVEALQRSNSELPGRNTQEITVEGKRVEFSSTLHRLLLWDVYRTAMKRAGWIGFGTNDTTGFPLNIPVGTEQLNSQYHLWSVDNQYILFDLRFGLLGVSVFTIWMLVAGGYFVRLALSAPQHGPFYAGMAGVTLGTIVCLLTVWMSHNFGFVLLWNAGIASGLWAGKLARDRAIGNCDAR